MERLRHFKSVMDVERNSGSNSSRVHKVYVARVEPAAAQLRVYCARFVETV